MTTHIQIIEGTYGGKSVAGEFFSLVRPYSTGKHGGFITVDGTSNKNFPQRNFRVLVENATSFSVVTETGNELIPVIKIEETDEEILARVGERFEILNEMSKATISGDIRAMIVTGPPGVGKSHGVETQMEKYALMDQITNRKLFYDVVKGAITALGLYKKLFENSQAGNVLIFDDCDMILSDELSLNLLKAALDSGKRRRICWNAESRVLRQEAIPNSFDFNGAVIFITNIDFSSMRSKKIVTHLQALQSRCHYLDLDMSTSRERMLRIKHVASNSNLFAGYKFENGEGDAIVNFMEENMEKLNELSLRMALKIADLIRATPYRWERAAAITCMGKKIDTVIL